MIILAFLSYALLVLREKRASIHCLRDVTAALELLYGELELHATPLPEAISRAARYCSGGGQALFQNLAILLIKLGEETFSDLWKKAVQLSCGSLSAPELEELERLGFSLGRYELSTQLREIRSCIAKLSRCREERAQSYPLERRLWLGLSAAAGCFLVILMI